MFRCCFGSALALRFLPVLFLLLPGAILSLYSQPILVLHDEKKSYSAEASAVVLEDPERTFTIDQVSSPTFSTRFHPVPSNEFNYGFTTSGYWVRCGYVRLLQTLLHGCLKYRTPDLAKLCCTPPPHREMQPRFACRKPA